MSSIEWITSAEAAIMLKVTIKTVRRYIADEKLPASKLGYKTVRIKKSSVEKLLRNGAQ